MNQPRITPGEWWAERADEYDRRNGRVHLASVILAPPPPGGDEPEVVAYADVPADVKLFLAAPALLEVVLMVCDSGVPLSDELTDKLVAALRKAGG